MLSVKLKWFDQIYLIENLFKLKNFIKKKGRKRRRGRELVYFEGEVFVWYQCHTFQDSPPSELQIIYRLISTLLCFASTWLLSFCDVVISFALMLGIIGNFENWLASFKVELIHPLGLSYLSVWKCCIPNMVIQCVKVFKLQQSNSKSRE